MKNLFESINVLLVDDDQEDCDLTVEILEMSKVKVSIEIVHDGVEAMEFLEKNKNNPKKFPDLILLDLNMPRMNGHEVIAALKKDECLAKIPIVVLTTSDAESDISKTYSGGVNCYVTKPVGLSQFQKVVDSISNFWFTVVKYPTAN